MSEAKTWLTKWALLGRPENLTIQQLLTMPEEAFRDRWPPVFSAVGDDVRYVLGSGGFILPFVARFKPGVLPEEAVQFGVFSAARNWLQGRYRWWTEWNALGRPLELSLDLFLSIPRAACDIVRYQINRADPAPVFSAPLDSGARVWIELFHGRYKLWWRVAAEASADMQIFDDLDALQQELPRILVEYFPRPYQL